jgi:hypothetical protein
MFISRNTSNLPIIEGRLSEGGVCILRDKKNNGTIRSRYLLLKDK